MSGILSGQAALVTGAGRGIGRAIAEKLAAAGAAVTVLSRTDRQLQEVVASIEKNGGRALAVTCDVTRREDVERAVQAAQEKFGPVTFLVNNAGQGGPFGPVDVVDPDEWWRAQALHVRAPFLFMRALIPAMKARRSGRILNICSVGAHIKEPNVSAYSVGKTTEIALTERVDLETREYGVRAFAVQPGTIITDMAMDTIKDPAAQRYVPHLIEMLRQLSPDASARALERCCEYAVGIAAGKYDALAGRYVDFSDDLDALAARATDRPREAGPMSPEQERLERNKQLVLTFYETVINRKDFDAGLPYIGDTYKQHNPTAQDGPEGLRAWLEEFKRAYPDARAHFKKVIAEGDLVVLHSYATGGPHPNGTALVDIFRVRDGKVVEHWDVIQAIPPDAQNSNSMF